jgi:hypothetical protein
MAREDLGYVTVTPDRGRAGEWGTWTVRFTAGAAGVQDGGGIQVALPDRWHQWHRNSARRVQATDPVAPFYVSARAGRPEVRVRCEVQEETPVPGSDDEQFVKRHRIGIFGRPSRYAWVVRVTVANGRLQPGDTIDVLYGDRSGGSRGFTPPLWGGSPERVRAAVDPTGSGQFVPLPDEALPWLYADPGDAVEVAVIVPSSTVVDEPAEALVVALDAYQNPVWGPDLQIELRVVEGRAELRPCAQSDDGRAAAAGRGAPASAGGGPLARSGPSASDGGTLLVTLDDGARWGSVRVPFVPRSEGIIRLRGQSVDGRLYALSNPSRCAAGRPAERLYWGDLHGHSQFSWDATGAGDDAFRYARDVAGLEVYGNADHGESLSEQEWEEIVACNQRYYEPGRFVTLVGYENSLRYPYGHHNVFYRGASGPLIHSKQKTLSEFWEQATPGEAITIPHHTVALGRPGRPNIDWSIHDERFRRLAEIYSGHGQSEVSASDHPLASDVVDFTFTGPASTPVQEGWLMGHRMGTIASSDNHCSRPGREGYGVMAVYAPELTREAVFDALLRRRTYGTTGSRIILDFTVNGTPMGGEARRGPAEPAVIQGQVIGTGPLRFVEVVRGDLDRREWEIVWRQWFGGMGAPRELAIDWTDERPPARALYYLRVRQRDLVHGRVAMAWSSPVWIERADDR